MPGPHPYLTSRPRLPGPWPLARSWRGSGIRYIEGMSTFDITAAKPEIAARTIALSSYLSRNVLRIASGWITAAI
jgi:hypothetical protein